MARRACLRLVMAVVPFAGEVLAAISLLAIMQAPAGAQFFDNGFGFRFQSRTAA